MYIHKNSTRQFFILLHQLNKEDVKMKKLSMIYALVITLALGAGQAMAAQFEIDLHGGHSGLPAGKTFDTSADINQRETIFADIWVTGIAQGQLVGIIDTQLLWDTTELEVVSVDNSFLTQPTGLWAGAPFAPFGLGSMFLEVIDFATGFPGPDIQMHTIELKCIQGADPRIASVIQVTDNGWEYWWDAWGTLITPYPTPVSITLNLGPVPPCSCDVTPDDPAPIIGSGSQQFTASPGVGCENPPNYVWDDGGCESGSVDPTGLFTAYDHNTQEETCMVCATDLEEQAVCCADIVIIPGCPCTLCDIYQEKFAVCYFLKNIIGRNLNYDDCDTYTNETDCENAECYWNTQGLPSPGVCTVDICRADNDFSGRITGGDLTLLKRDLGRVDCPCGPYSEDLCLKYLEKYNCCITLYPPYSPYDYCTYTNQTACENAGCYWNTQGLPPPGVCTVDLCLADSDFSGRITGGDLEVMKKELGRVSCPFSH